MESETCRVAFVMEQTLGHVTHHANLARLVAVRRDIDATWLPVPYDVTGAGRFVPMFRHNWSIRASWRARRALRRAMSTWSFDALVFHTQVTSLFSVGLMRRIPTVVSLDATPANFDSVGVAYGHRAAGDGMIDQRKSAMNRAVFHAAGALVTWSDWAKASLVRDYGVEADRITVLAPGASEAYFEIGALRYAAPERMDSTRPLRVLFVGGDLTRKGAPLLLELMRGPLRGRCELHIVTNESLEREPGVFVHRGLRSGDAEHLELFARADIFVLPSFGECLAVALMEASAAGLPIVTTRVGALGEAVADGRSGFVVASGDRDALGAAITRLAADPRLRRRMGAESSALAQRRFDARTNNHAFVDLVKTVAARGASERRAA